MSEPISLIVDDEPSIRAYLRDILDSQGIRSVEAASAVEALKTLHKLEGHVDLLITDIQMPGDMDGLELAYSAVNSFPALPVILISGYSDKSPGRFMLIRKPFVPNVILEAVHQAITPKLKPANPGVS